MQALAGCHLNSERDWTSWSSDGTKAAWSALVHGGELWGKKGLGLQHPDTCPGRARQVEQGGGQWLQHDSPSLVPPDPAFH